MENTLTALATPAAEAGTVTILLAPSLELAQTVSPLISVEAEYGDTVVQGALYTAAHHGSRAANPCPCVDASIPAIGAGRILVSHIDLDTVGGVGRAIGHPACGGRHGMFWRLAAFVDTAGPHRLAEVRQWDAGPSLLVERQLHAYWAWAQANRGPRRDPGVVHDVTAEVKRHLALLLDIFGEREDGSLLQAGDEFKAAGERLNAESFLAISSDGVIRRRSDAFVNHLYTAPSGEVGNAVIAFNTQTKAMTLSFAEKGDPRNACEIMQAAFGPEAGGHKGIAGSPRGVEVENPSKAMAAIEALCPAQ